MPMRAPPRLATSPLPTKPFEVRPVPAIRTLGLVGSTARLAIDSERWLSLSGAQLAPPLRVTHTPPLTAPIYIVLGFVGSVTIACTAPATVPLGGASPLWMVAVGPKLGDGPCGTKVWASAAVAHKLASAATSRVEPVVRGRSRNKAIMWQPRKPS